MPLCHDSGSWIHGRRYDESTADRQGNTSEVVVPHDADPGDSAGPAAVPHCAVAESQLGDVRVLTVAGTVDVLTAPQLKAAIAAAAGRSPTAIVVDLTAVEFLASTGMGVLVEAHGQLAPAVRLVVVADGPATSRPLKLVGIANIIDLFATLDEAVADITG